LARLTALGISEKRATKALIAAGNNLDQAMAMLTTSEHTESEDTSENYSPSASVDARHSNVAFMSPSEAAQMQMR